MLAELLEQNHRQQVGPGPSPGDHVEGGRCLADLLAIPAGELLPHRFDHLPLARDRLQGPGHVLAQLAQPRSATTIASRRRIDRSCPTAWCRSSAPRRVGPPCQVARAGKLTRAVSLTPPSVSRLMSVSYTHLRAH